MTDHESLLERITEKFHRNHSSLSDSDHGVGDCDRGSDDGARRQRWRTSTLRWWYWFLEKEAATMAHIGVALFGNGAQRTTIAYVMVCCAKGRVEGPNSDCDGGVGSRRRRRWNWHSDGGDCCATVSMMLGYESNGFYDQTTLPGNVGMCSNRTASQASAFDSAVQGLLTDLEAATPRINGSFAAVKRDVVGGGSTVYAVAQCAETVSESGCRDCLMVVAYGNLQSCPPDAEGRAVDAGCFLRYSDTPFFSDNQTTNISPFLGGGSSKKNKAIIGGVVGGGGGLLLIVGLILWYKLSRKAKKAPRGNILGASELQGPVTFSYKDLKWATKDFSDENKLGGGGFGDVYKGTLKNGNVVAVKKLAIGSSRAQADFGTEVKLISERRGALNWKQRFDIIFGTARDRGEFPTRSGRVSDELPRKEAPIRGSQGDSPPLCKIPATKPKIADFGLARLLPNDQSHLSTRFAGTLGYTAPEYAIHGQLSEKVDTYSFGVVVLEIISGRRCNEMTVEPLTEYLLEQAWKLYENDMHLKLVDETLDSNEYREEEMKKPMFIDNDKRVRGDTSVSTGSSTSHATASFTEFTGR
ncbi:cysteine-rich RLK (RECEPTOR-like protein kinase) 34 [Actinidia rufa]|uniref:Cysteine-rich RLK (RECEPTOR-like protein kinase) 34 n=1 Tax=Actinidia rufa TaxID=165716 RepID=A0A7J0GFM8_9ERIC|nr:cysteine-rich RLK (RECEPTOR-like protein kinase) 34 [Actinidia rufa]